MIKRKKVGIELVCSNEGNLSNILIDVYAFPVLLNVINSDNQLKAINIFFSKLLESDILIPLFKNTFLVL